MPGGGLRRYCKKKTLAFVDTCLDHDELSKVKKCHGCKHTLYNGYDDNNDDPYDEDPCNDPCNKLSIYPIGSKKDKFDDFGALDYNEESKSAHSFLSKLMIIDPLVAAKLLSAFPSDGTSAVCIEYGSDNQISGWDDGCFYPTFILLVTDDLTVAYASMGF
eukprot:scaffold24846_cov33-Attheya_sp.AAC.3